MKQVTKVVVSGFGCSGSSAVVDWLREYRSCHVLDDEFDLFRHPDGVQDLRDALTMRVSVRRCYLAMRRFSNLTRVMARRPGRNFGRDLERITFRGFENHMRAFLAELTAVSYPAGSTATWIERHGEVSHYATPVDESSVSPRMQEFLVKLHRRAQSPTQPKSMIAKSMLRWMGHPLPAEREEMYQPLSLTGEEFDAIARRYFDEMARRMVPPDKSHLVLDQAVGPSGMPGGLDLMSDVRAIVVHRDPRDIFMSGLTKNRHWVPTNSAEDFARWFRIAMPRIKLDDPRICVVGFEDLVTEPSRYLSYMERFLGLCSRDRPAPGSMFEPRTSLKNVRKWQLHPDQDLICKVARLCRPHYEAMLENNTQITEA